MKNLTRPCLVMASALLTTAVSHANQATSELQGDITCTAPHFSVRISADRKTLTISKPGLAPEVYTDMEETDGDTDTWYTPKGLSAPTLNFGDENDFLQFNSKQNGITLTCPQGAEDQN